MGFDIPDKRYFKIGEVSKLADVAPYVIRYWESEFDQIQPKRASSNQRLYHYEDVERILTIKTLLHIRGYTIAGARRFLKSGRDLETETTPSAARAETRQKLHALKQELLRLYRELERKRG